MWEKRSSSCSAALETEFNCNSTVVFAELLSSSNIYIQKCIKIFEISHKTIFQLFAVFTLRIIKFQSSSKTSSYFLCEYVGFECSFRHRSNFQSNERANNTKTLKCTIMKTNYDTQQQQLSLPMKFQPFQLKTLKNSCASIKQSFLVFAPLAIRNSHFRRVASALKCLRRESTIYME